MAPQLKSSQTVILHYIQISVSFFFLHRLICHLLDFNVRFRSTTSSMRKTSVWSCAPLLSARASSEMMDAIISWTFYALSPLTSTFCWWTEKNFLWRASAKASLVSIATVWLVYAKNSSRPLLSTGMCLPVRWSSSSMCA